MFSFFGHLEFFSLYLKGNLFSRNGWSIYNKETALFNYRLEPFVDYLLFLHSPWLICKCFPLMNRKEKILFRFHLMWPRLLVLERAGIFFYRLFVSEFCWRNIL